MDFYSYLTETTRQAELSQYYTPQDIAQKMVELVSSYPTGVWLDPCCGTGVLSYELAMIQPDPVDFIQNSLILNDLDPLSTEIAAQIFMEEFGVAPRIFNENFLTFDFPDYDFIIMNPPYGKTEIDLTFKSAKCKDTYGYFLEKASASAKGFISINPISFTNAGTFKPLREILLKQYSHLDIYNFDNIPGHIFSDVKTRISIIVADNFSKERRATTMLRWGQTERTKLLDNLDDYLGKANFSSLIFYKTTPETVGLTTGIKTTLNDKLSKTATPYCLYITSAPRYFITASHTKLDRKGQTEIFLKDEDSFNKAYLQLNSSYLYWWWRTCDSSMSLTKTTLTALPWLDIPVDFTLIEKLTQSEIDNRVYKANAGSVQENVKHPESLMKELNKAVLPDMADHLLSLHKNILYK
jgi:predicted RNA methylase